MLPIKHCIQRNHKLLQLPTLVELIRAKTQRIAKKNANRNYRCPPNTRALLIFSLKLSQPMVIRF